MDQWVVVALARVVLNWKSSISSKSRVILARLAVVVAIHSGVGAIPCEELRLSERVHLTAV